MSGGNINNHRAHPTFACMCEKESRVCIGSKRLVGPKAVMVCTHIVLAWQAQTVLTLQGLGRPGHPCTHRQKLWRERRTCEPVGKVFPKLAKACVSSRTSEHTHTHTPTQTYMLSSEFITWVCNMGRFLKNLAHLRQFCTQTKVKLMHTYTQKHQVSRFEINFKYIISFMLWGLHGELILNCYP